MSGVEVALPLISGAAVAIFAYKKFQYKKLKNAIYKIIQEGIDNLDYEMILEGIGKLKEFDISFKDIKSGEAMKGVWEKINCRSIRLPKMEKLQEKFGITLEDIESIDSIKKWVENVEKNVEGVGKELGLIKDEENKNDIKLLKIKNELELVKSAHLLKNNQTRKVVDDLNLTEVIQQMQEDYERLFINTFNKSIDIKSLLQLDIKKQLLEKKVIIEKL